MRRALLTVLLLLPLAATAQETTYDKAAINDLLQEQNYSAVLRQTAAIPTESMDAWLLSTTGYAAYQQGQMTGASQRYERLLGMDSTNTAALLYLGLISKDARSWEQSAGFLYRLNTLRPGNSRYALLLSEVYGGMKHPDSARQQLELAFLYDTTSPSLCTRLGQTYIGLKQYQRADSVLTIGLRQHPSSGAILGAGIQTAYWRKQPKQLDALFDRWVLAGEYNFPPLYYAMLSQMDRKNYTRSLELFKLMQELDMASTAVYYYAAKAEAGLGHMAQSTALLQECIAQSTDDKVPVYYTEMGANFELQKKYPAALACYDTAWYLGKDRNVLYRKGLACEAAGNAAGAKTAYRQYLREATRKGGPDDAVTQYVRQYLAAPPKP